MANYLVRGILIGGSLGVLASLVGIFDMGRGAILGATAGGFAGWTMESKQQRKQEAAKKAEAAREREMADATDSTDSDDGKD